MGYKDEFENGGNIDGYSKDRLYYVSTYKAFEKQLKKVRM